MNKAMMIAIQPKWSNMIKEGTKTFEFRNYAIPKGTKVYLYESLGKSKPRHLCEDYPNYIGFDTFEGKYAHNVFEGWGMVVAEFVVGECYEVNPPNWEDSDEKYAYLLQSKELYMDNLEEAPAGYWKTWLQSKKDFKESGYTNQKHAHSITDLIVYDEEWIKKELLHIDNKTMKYNDKLTYAPTSPIPVTEFVSWNKLSDFVRTTTRGGILGKIEYKLHPHTLEKYKLTHAPQGRVYVVERND